MSPQTLATLSAVFNATTMLLLLAGRRAIRRRQIQLHRQRMLMAVGSSVLFLVFYVSRMLIHGDVRYGGEDDATKMLYLALLASHVLLAMALLPMVLRTLFLGLKRRDDNHRKIARFTYPVWIYVSVTGVVVYLVLFYGPGAAAT